MESTEAKIKRIAAYSDLDLAVHFARNFRNMRTGGFLDADQEEVRLLEDELEKRRVA